MAQKLEEMMSEFRYPAQITTDKNVVMNGNLTVAGTTNIATVSLTDLTTTGNTTLGNAVSDTTAINGATTITTTSASGLTVGRQGATAPVLKVDAATASVATGVSITGAAAAGGVAIAAISSGTDESVTLDAKGAGTLTINGTATGNIVLGRAMTGVSASLTGGYVSKSGTAAPASAGAVAAGVPLSLFSNGIGIYVTTDAPAFSAIKGSLCIALDGSSSSTRLFINNGTTNWVAVTTAS